MRKKKIFCQNLQNIHDLNGIKVKIMRKSIITHVIQNKCDGKNEINEGKLA